MNKTAAISHREQFAPLLKALSHLARHGLKRLRVLDEEFLLHLHASPHLRITLSRKGSFTLSSGALSVAGLIVVLTGGSGFGEGPGRLGGNSSAGIEVAAVCVVSGASSFSGDHRRAEGMLWRAFLSKGGAVVRLFHALQDQAAYADGWFLRVDLLDFEEPLRVVIA